ncbi:MAG: hypothetical protein ACO1QB_06970 [Verrucomicrobiales bacterium]
MKQLFFLTSVLVFVSLAGCAKKETQTVEEAAPEEAPAAEAAAAAPAAEAAGVPQKLTVAEAVRAAMEKRQYSDAVRLVMQMQASAQNEAQAQEAAVLKQEIKLTLMEVSATDRKAYEALGVLRATTLGR